jgi:signal transduction histidine kinase
MYLIDSNFTTIDTFYLSDDEDIHKIQKFEESDSDIFVSVSDNKIYQFNNDFSEYRTITFPYQARVIGRGDFLMDGSNVFLISTSNEKILLVDKDFSPLAQFDGDRHLKPYFDKQDNQYKFLTSSTKGSFIGVLNKTPWYTIFLRYPIQTQYVLLFILLSTLTYILFLIRKNRIISFQKKTILETQEKLIEAEKYINTKNIAGSFAHEIRNALFPAKAWLSKISVSDSDSGNVQNIRQTNQSIDKAVQMTDLILEFSKLQKPKDPVPCNLKQIISKVIDINHQIVSTQNILFELNIEESIVVIGDERHLGIIFNNLLLNSCDTLTEKEEKRIISINAVKNSKKIEITFSDNGSGIDPTS